MVSVLMMFMRTCCIESISLFSVSLSSHGVPPFLVPGREHGKLCVTLCDVIPRSRPGTVEYRSIDGDPPLEPSVTTHIASRLPKPADLIFPIYAWVTFFACLASGLHARN